MPILNKVPISDPSGGCYDVIRESTPATGVTVDGLLIKDGAVAGKKMVSDLTAASTLTAADSGKVLFLNSATEFATTLPTPAAGLNYKFIVKAAPVGANYTVVTGSSANIIIGSLSCSTADDLGASDADADTITFVASAAIVGDWVELVSDGTSWYLSGNCFVAEGITVTKAS